MTYQEIMKDLKAGQYKPVYFLQGEEPYYIDKISDYIEQNVLTDAEKGFNQSVLYGKEVDSIAVMEITKRYPMGSQMSVVILKEAQQMRDLDGLESYINQPLESTILVICHKYKNLDKRKTFYKSIAKKSVVFTSARLYENKVPEWINGWISAKGFSIHPKAAILLTDYLGVDLSKISNELEKLLINLEPGTMIEVDHIESNIGISKDYNVFELQSALGRKDVIKANRIVNYFIANPGPNPMVMVLGTLYAFFSKLYMLHYSKGTPDNQLTSLLGVHPFFLKEYKAAGTKFGVEEIEKIIGMLNEYDLKAKGVGNTGIKDGELMKELVYQILHATHVEVV